ncbi:Transcription activator of gluconeogenesis acuK [Lecanosticta acicola]|uniref:Transcription activator of gluconeogenesis acuK n=1 Tax=Lecanosticta acicola TaxID=111012 RepID=A0AAI8Z2F1_9PEZI|nr:Transcription activator of gluconeogenesis acuK [Lecanosticta acicola]
MSLDAEDASPSPEPGAEQDESGIMAEEKVERASTEEKSPAQQTNNGNASSNGSGTTPAKSNAKDPSRPRRKKARRACFACQRAHLTCGDERPCLRCIKRGLQDQCHDGVRKKAKYLHDAPAEALMPGFAQNYALNGSHGLSNAPGSATIGPNVMSVSQASTYYPQTAASGFPQYSGATQPGQMGPPMMDNNSMVPDFTSSQTVGTPTGFQSSSSQQVSPNQEFTNAMDQNLSIGTAGSQSLETPYLDPNDPSLFNFNISELNFGNHYGALEFGMLGHISSGAVNTPDLNQINLGDSNQGSISYDRSGSFSNYNQSYPSWQSVPNLGSRQSSNANIWATQNNGLEAYAIGEQAPSLTGASPHSQNQDYPGLSSSNASPETRFAQPQPEHHQQSELLRQSFSHQPKKASAFPGDPHYDMHRKRRRNASEIYSSVTEPYPYTQGFHALMGVLRRRYPQAKMARIAQALASIRPSFIACNQHLNHDDLVFMEKCFQRTLCEYEDFIGNIGTPTVLLRRTGEIASVSKEFCLITGWRRDVLLGKEPNLNVNTSGSNISGTQTGTSSRGAATPRVSEAEMDTGRPQPILLAELMDEDAVVQFYEDFAELAFGASKTSMASAPCSLLKYRTKDDPGWGAQDRFADDGKRIKQQGGDSVKSEHLIRGEAGMNALGERDGRVQCQMCWTVRRDVFDMPMLIVVNFLPLI